MGCTPSIHVSQTGVVYCRSSDDSNSPRPPCLGATAVSNVATTSGTAATASVSGHTDRSSAVTSSTVAAVAGLTAGNRINGDGGESTTSSSAMVVKDHQQTASDTRPITEAETQTSTLIMKGANSEVNFGPMKIRQHPMTVMLVFAKEDAQSDGFWWAADKAGYKCNILRNAESALECFLDKHHHVVIIDNRHSKYFDAEALCRSIRATKCSEHTVIVTVMKKTTGDKEEPSILPLIHAGFDKRIIENANVSVCLNELISLEHGEVRTKLQLCAASALCTAVENSSDAIEISSEDFHVQYVNPAHERLFGYTCEEMVGKDSRELTKSDRNRPDHQDTMTAQLRKAKPWEGVYYVKKKSGENFSHTCKVFPVTAQTGRIRHYVSSKSAVLEPSTLERLSNADLGQLPNDTFGYRSSGFRKGSFDVRSLSSDGGVHGFNRRRESVARIHSMMIEAPITKVINIINAAQESSPITVVQALDKVLEILRSSELYSPFFTPSQAKEDQMTTDLVGGLMTTQSIKRRFSSTEGSIKAVSHLGHGAVTHLSAQSPVSSTVLSQVPMELQALLEKEPSWDFNVLNLETLTKKRPLVYLGLKTFQRFSVLEYLQISEQTMVEWLQVIEVNYHSSNSYHNSTHAADVLHATAYFLQRDRLKNVFDQMDEVASLIAAVIHDLDHPGRTNSFLINQSNELALLYNDLAVLESHHVSLAFQLTQKNDRINIFKNLDREDGRAIRQQIVDMVLATEMTKHFEHVSKFVSSINKPGPKADDDVCSISGRGTPSSSSPSDLTTPENRMLIKRMLIKCADVCNPTRPRELCVEWAKRIAEEYCQQTDDEKQLSLPVVMPVFDRKSCNVPKSQTSFIDLFINNMFDAWDAFCDIPDLMMHLQNNYKYWKEQEETAAKALAEIETVPDSSETETKST